MATKKRTNKAKESTSSASSTSSSSLMASLPEMPDEVQAAIMSFAHLDEWLSLRSVTKSMKASYGTKLPSLRFRQRFGCRHSRANPSGKSLVLLMEKQERLEELQISRKGVLSSVAAVLCRGKCQKIKRVRVDTNVTKGELDALAAAIELEGLPMLEYLNVGCVKYDLSSFVSQAYSYKDWSCNPKMRVIFGVKKLFEVALSQPSLRELHVPRPMTSVDLEALADALEIRRQRGLPGLTKLDELTDKYLIVDNKGEFEGPGYDDDDNQIILDDYEVEVAADGRLILLPQSFDIIARILKICLPTLESLFDCGALVYKSHHPEAFGQCILVSPPMALMELTLYCCEIEKDFADGAAFAFLFNALKTTSVPSLEHLNIEDPPLGAQSMESLCSAIESGAFPRLKNLDLHCSLINDDGMVTLSRTMTAYPHLFQHMTQLALNNSGFGEEGAKALFLSLQAGACPVLRKLHVSGNKFGDEGLMSLVSALEEGAPCSNSLAVVDLSDCGIGWKGVKYLFNAMIQSKGVLPNIQMLDLSSNKAIGDEGIAVMLEAFRMGAGGKIKELDIKRMGMGDKGAKLLGHAVVNHALPRELYTLRYRL